MARLDPPYTHLRAWDSSGLKEKWLPTMNVYNSFGVAVARAIDEETAALIAAALNAKGVEVARGEHTS